MRRSVISLAAAAAGVTATTLVVAGSGAPGGAQTDETLTIVPISDAQRGVALAGDGSVMVTETSRSPAGAGDDEPVPPTLTSTITLVDLVAEPPVTTDLVAAVGDPNGVAPAISADGCVVVYSTVLAPDETGLTDPDDPENGVAPTTEPPAESLPPHTSVPDGADDSGDAAGLAAQAEPDATVTLRAVDRCGGGAPTAITLPEPAADRSDAYPPAALSADGSTIVVSTGDDIVVLTDQNAASEPPAPPSYAETARFDASADPSDGSATGDIVGVSADGSTVVFEASAADDDLTPPEIRVWTVDEGPVLLASDATSPSISGDGSIVAFRAGDRSPVATPGVSVVRRGVDPFVVRNVSPDGVSPVISGDGAHLAFVTDEGLAAADWSAGDDPFAPDSFTVSTLPASLDPSRPAIDHTGATVAAIADGDPDPDPGIWSRPPVASFDRDTYDLGSGLSAEVLSASAVLTNDGPSSVRIDSTTAVVSVPFGIDLDECPASLRPGQSCQVVVDLVVGEDDGLVTGEIVVLGVRGSTVARAALAAQGPAPAPTVPTTAPPTTTGGSTGGGTTGGGTTGGTGGTTTGGTTGGTTGSTTRGTTGGTTTRGTTTRGTTTGGTATTTTTTAAVGVPSFSPSRLDIAPTIVDAGRRTARLELRNSGNAPLTVESLAFDPGADEGGLTVASTDCVPATIAAGGACTVDVQFAPTELGEFSADLVASSTDGTVARATVAGVGAPAPTLEVLPQVAAAGQVVTVIGAGFPAGSTVELAFADDTSTVLVDDVGVFEIPLLVLPDSVTGPLEVSVAGVVDSYGDVVTQLLVDQTPSSSDVAVFGGGFGVDFGA